MNQKKAKELKKIINYNKEDPTINRLFSKLKKQYNGLSRGAKPIFLDKLRKMYDNN